MFQQKMQEEEENRFCIYRNKTFNRRKIMIIFVAVLLLMVFLMGRLVYLMIFCSEYYGVRAENLHERERDIKAARGNIYDRNGVVLAENKTVCTISVIHSQIEDPEKVIAVLTKELGMSEETVRKRVEKVSSIERIKTNVEKETGDAIRSYELAGVKIDEDYKRYYPYNELASKVIGFTGGDNQGIIGIEVKYDEYLEKHRQAVKKAYQWIAAYIPELTDVEATRNIEFHDMSKNTPDEYTPYDNYFYGEQTPAIIEAFNRAWLMHIHRNPHHWQYWVLINDEPKEGTILIEMPYPYIIEMICDWWAFSWIKGDLSEMFAWYKDHADYIKLHNNTRSIVEEILEMIRTKLTEVENAEN